MKCLPWRLLFNPWNTLLYLLSSSSTRKASSEASIHRSILLRAQQKAVRSLTLIAFQKMKTIPQQTDRDPGTRGHLMLAQNGRHTQTHLKAYPGISSRPHSLSSI